MTPTCRICGKLIMDGQRVHIGILTTLKDIPSQKSWAVEKPDDYTFIHHAHCEDLQ